MIPALVEVEKSLKSVMVHKELISLNKRLGELAKSLHIDELKKRREQLDLQMQVPGFWDNAEIASSLSKEASDIDLILGNYAASKELFDEAEVSFELADDDPSFLQTGLDIAKKLQDKIESMEVESWFSSKFDHGDAIMSINPGQGGLEAQDWTEMLFRMYTHYFDKKKWSYKVLDLVSGERIGLDRVTLQVNGRCAYGMLRSEIGVHRLVRISPTDIKKRRHTTFASVEVLPVLPDDIDIEIDANDVRVDVYRSSGPGGQCVNTTDSAVRLTHIPTGIVVTCQNEKSQLLNKEAAFSVLRSRLYEIEQKKREEELDELRGEQSSSSFGSQIRNYVLYPFQLVKDTRSNVETSNTSAVLDGDIDEFVIGYHKWRTSL